MFEPLAYYILQTVWCLILEWAALFWSTIKEDLSSLWLLSQARRGKFVTNLFQPDELQFRDRDGKWLERNGWGSPVIERVSQRRHFESWGGETSLRGKKKMQSALIVQSQHERRRRELPQQRTTWGYSAVRHKFRHTNRNTCALCIWIPSQGREGGFRNLFICRFPLVGLMKNSKYMENKKKARAFFFFFFLSLFYLQTNTMEVHESCLPPAATNAVFVGCSPDIRCIWLCGFSGSARALKGSYLKSLIPAWLFGKEGQAVWWFCEDWIWR